MFVLILKQAPIFTAEDICLGLWRCCAGVPSPSELLGGCCHLNLWRVRVAPLKLRLWVTFEQREDPSTSAAWNPAPLMICWPTASDAEEIVLPTLPVVFNVFVVMIKWGLSCECVAFCYCFLKLDALFLFFEFTIFTSESPQLRTQRHLFCCEWFFDWA